ncbi:MAG TPA: saccharopine dehydrogenase NADP-binding domain-containing protein [Kofleriaceae bacterium]|nr:saccharopine dehydrogenase NADP-binding domain-containing protein [Kofleriaceae bacterium]
MTREFDLVLFGATGFTGRLVAEYLAAAATRDPVRWAIAGRSRDKLAALGIAAPIVVADALDPAAIRALAERTSVVCTTAGPYTRYGSELVAACARAGTHYCDLTGEVPWMRRMIDAHHATARTTGARIVHTCGFDSIPSDLGCWATQQAFIAQFGHPARQVTAVYGEQSGGLSGGTAASAFELMREADADPVARALLRNPYALDPDPAAARPPAPDYAAIGWQRTLRKFTMPFVMAQVNTRVVRRGHALAGLPWGDDFVYREMMSTPGNPLGAARAVGMTSGLALLGFAMSRPMLRDQLAKRAPRPGEGPAPEVRARGHWIARFVAEDAGGNTLVYVVSDRADPGYGSTAKMLGEAALCLARDPLGSPGGVQTPSVAMAAPLLDRLRRAGLQFAPA